MFGGGVYKAPEREVGEASGQTLRVSVTATVTHDTIKFVATPKAEFGVAEVYSKNHDFPGYTTLTMEEKEKGTTQTAQSAIDGDRNYGDGDAPTPITFTGNGEVVTRDKERTPIFTFEYVLPYIAANTWTFTKTGNTGGMHD